MGAGAGMTETNSIAKGRGKRDAYRGEGKGGVEDRIYPWGGEGWKKVLEGECKISFEVSPLSNAP